MGAINSIGNFFGRAQRGMNMISETRELYGSGEMAVRLGAFAPTSRQVKEAKEALEKVNPEMAKKAIGFNPFNHLASGLMVPFFTLGKGSKKLSAGDVINFTKKTFKGTEENFGKALESNFRTTGFNLEDLYNVAEDGTKTLKQNISGVTVDFGFWSSFKMAHRNHATGEYSAGRIATTAAGLYVGASSVARLASGGGLYRDKDGNTDIIGIPGI